MPTFQRTHSEDLHFISLVDELNAWLRIKDGDKHEYYNQFNQIEGIPYVLVVYEENQAIACGAMKPYNKTTLEIKRMFTRPRAQGQGLGRSILVSLEEWAGELGYRTLILETGRSFTTAIQLYKNYGFEQISNYDQYAGIKDSVCFQKQIDKVVN